VKAPVLPARSTSVRSRAQSVMRLLLAVGTVTLVGSCTTEDPSPPVASSVVKPTPVATAAPVSSPEQTTTTTPQPSDQEEPLGGLNGTRLEKELGPAVVMVLTRPCGSTGVRGGSGFAIGDRTIVTNWHVVADDYNDPESTIDPHPWILGYNRRWRRGTVIGSSASPDVAVIKLDEDEPDMPDPLRWADRALTDGQFAAVLGYPGIEEQEFQLTIGKASDVDGTTEDIPSFQLDRQLSNRTGPGNSGGPVVNADGEVVGMHTWGRFNRSTWFAQDHDVVRSAVESFVSAPSQPRVECQAEDPSRFPLAYTVRLGTFGDRAEADARLAVVNAAGPPGTGVVMVDSDELTPYLLSDYPYVLAGGPFETRPQAEEALLRYQAAATAAGHNDKFSVGVLPRSVFVDATAEPAPSCLPSADGLVVVHGVASWDTLALRQGPSTNQPELARLANGEQLLVGSEEPVRASGADWIHVSTTDSDDPICGWVAQRYTRPVTDG